MPHFPGCHQSCFSFYNIHRSFDGFDNSLKRRYGTATSRTIKNNLLRSWRNFRDRFSTYRSSSGIKWNRSNGERYPDAKFPANLNSITQCRLTFHRSNLFTRLPIAWSELINFRGISNNFCSYYEYKEICRRLDMDGTKFFFRYLFVHFPHSPYSSGSLACWILSRFLLA